MKKSSVLALALAGILSSSLSNAQGARGYRVETNTGSMRVGALCELRLFGLTQPGRCVVGRSGRTTVISVDNGDSTYQIVRDPYDKFSGVFFHEKDGEKKRLASVIANGECWIGDNVRFCAK